MRIAILTFDGVQSLDVTGPLEVFTAAGQIAGRPYAIELVAAERRAVRTSSGLDLLPHAAFDDPRPPADTLLVAGGKGSRAAAGDEATLVLRAAHRP